MKNANVAIRQIDKEDVFNWWLLLTQPFHKLSAREISVVEAYLQEEYKLRRSITDESILRDMLYSTATRKRIMGKVGIDSPQFNNMLTMLRHKGVFKGKELNPRFFPNIELDADKFRIIFEFKFNG